MLLPFLSAPPCSSFVDSPFKCTSFLKPSTRRDSTVKQLELRRRRWSLHFLNARRVSLFRHRCCLRNLDDSCTFLDHSIPEAFSGLGGEQKPISVCETRTLPAALTLTDARDSLLSAVADLRLKPPLVSSGLLRFQVPFAPGIRALQWLHSQDEGFHLRPCCYFSPRRSHVECGTSGAKHELGQEEFKDVFNGIAGVGSAVLFKGVNSFSSKDWRSIKRFLSKDSPLVRAYGAIRFNADIEPSPEWQSFGSFYFFIPQIEFCENSSCCLLAVNVSWDDTLEWVFDKAVDAAIQTLTSLSDEVDTRIGVKVLNILKKEHVPCETAWHDIVKRVLEAIDSNESKDSSISNNLSFNSSCFDGTHLSKVVLARRTELEIDAAIDPLALLTSLQENDPDAYQFCIQTPQGTAFIGNSPERLFYRDGSTVISEAVAATRARGDTEGNDILTSIDLLASQKDHHEFEIVRDSLKRNMESVCNDVKVELDKGLIKHAHVMHLYAFLVGKLDAGDNEFNLISGLHPTPAVCGHPKELAKNLIEQTEMFDRGMYAGPVGWIGSEKTEFAVGIRSSLIEPRGRASPQGKCLQGTRLYLYAGVGVVKGSRSSLEWQELDLKINQFEAVLQPSLPFENAANVNTLWAELIIEECCRLGVTHFCIAPGSRSSPLAVAASRNHRASCFSCIDERSLGFYALGFGRASYMPAAVITSSGTAVSNLLPAVVEGSQDCVPLLLLTADRPPELQDAGENQTIDQVNHFGAFVRYHVKLPVPDDKMQARMVLTSLDAAVFRATSDPRGPVHINCPFRDPLVDISCNWDRHCLQGLATWSFGLSPFTKYVKSFVPSARLRHCSISIQMKEVVSIIGTASRGLIIVGGPHIPEETWATLLLAECLGWPVIPDILSGLRLRQVGHVKHSIHIIDNFDHILLSKSAQESILPDVILQIGSRLTSKRLRGFLEFSKPLAYILVEEHPYRHDPSHLLTHRVQSSVMEFISLVNCLSTSCESEDFVKQMKHLSKVVMQARLEILFQLQVESPLTEPRVAQIVAQSVKSDSALFLGNSMAIRDVDMYAEGEVGVMSVSSDSFDDFPFAILGIQTAGNRGANGIDGVLSTAIGFAAGSQKHVTVLVGDISFLHDTNGLMLLKERVRQPSVTVVVVNNFGGGIFSMLPVANMAPKAAFTKFFTTPHNISIQNLCVAHRVQYTRVKTSSQLKEALLYAKQQQSNWVIEAESNVENNADFHRFLQLSVQQSVNHGFPFICQPGCTLGSKNPDTADINKVSYFHYRIPLLTHVTTTVNRSNAYREGFLLQITLSNGYSGFGEVAPLEGLHEEDIIASEQQLRMLVQSLKGVKVTGTLALLNGSISDWLSDDVGIPSNALHPTVRCGLEMALLGAVALFHKCSLADLLLGFRSDVALDGVSSSRIKERTIRVCALLDSDGTPGEVALLALELVNQGFCSLKIKVGRRASPLDDAAVLMAIRDQVGPNVNLRADANQRWTFSQAVEFTEAVRSCQLQYLEEPIMVPEEIPRFCEETGFPIALDESIDGLKNNLTELMAAFAHPGVVAAIIKPSSVGGFEHAALIAKEAQRLGVVAVISAAFESSISLAAYTQFAAYVDEKRLKDIPLVYSDRRRLYQKHGFQKVAHGLGTYMWLGSDVVMNRKFSVRSVAGGMEASIKDTADLLQNTELNISALKQNHVETNFSCRTCLINCSHGSYSFHVLDSEGAQSKSKSKDPVLVFLHGFLGHGEDWLPIMQALSISYRCMSIDLPGHGKTKIKDYSLLEHHELTVDHQVGTGNAWSIDGISEALCELFKKMTKQKVVIIGYSMGARLSLYMALRFNQQVEAGVIISGSPGMQHARARRERADKDDALAMSLRLYGLQSFVHTWYKRPLWNSLRNHSRFKEILNTRMQHEDVDGLARVLSSLSTGRQSSLWEDLAQNQIPLLFVAGKQDNKFLDIAHKMSEIVPENPSNNVMDKCVHSTVPNFNGLQNDKAFTWPIFLKGRSQPDKPFRNKQQETGKLSNTTGKKEIHRCIVEVEDSGHAVHLENPLKLVEAVRKFLSKLNASSYF